MAKAIDQAFHEQRTVKIKLHSMKMSADLWRRYSVLIDTDNKKVVARIGPLVTTGQTPVPETEPPEDEAVAESRFSADLLHTYEAESFIDIWHGNDYAFVPEGEHVRADFIPWHRRWSHSLTMGCLFAPLGLLLYGINELGITASAIIVAAFWAHIILDQTGMLGSNLFYPFTRKQSNGWGLVRSGDAIPNFFTNYSAVLVMIWNFNAYAYEPAFSMPLPGYLALWFQSSSTTEYWLGLLNYVICFIIIPLGILYVAVHLYTKKYLKEPEPTREEAVAEESLREIEEIITR